MFKKSKESVEDKKNKKEERITERKPKRNCRGGLFFQSWR